ncbi:MAG: RnfABCDGE type electron transport complex subunit D [Candidatus Krumholzibacteria bacterium]|nr:RnfABCDGE type electron transport complex subunit D [Candidatus Krumholzibacteria bacterium]MDH4338325.1 RnfABCDGE type electron transport complex subunit D [Candidatus Krumholzibacteria bacterium]MDH5270801.1 RnfABCDGE type electron transport complex subunit D [Candidatus Krumholzibacteria bacterium]MDH5627033.1 RnfABCDGE type electron transport complex subunit D [Candidatus Krumholzibacteria bacterium]
MSSNAPHLILATSPFLKRPVDTPMIMRHVIYSLVPAMLAAAWYFGLSAIMIIVATVAGAMLTEWFFKGRRPFRDSTVADGSAAVTGVLLALTLPPSIPLWMAFLGGAIAIVFGKLIFGGLGHNIFNPSLVGRAFLQASFPVALTTWTAQRGAGGMFGLQGGNLALPLLRPDIDAITTATPLARMKFEATATPLGDLLTGATAGSVGETSAILLLVGGAYLAYRKFLNWRIPLAIFVGVYAVATLLHLLDGTRPDGLFHLMSGGLMLGALFMATDPVTSPVTPLGMWVFGAGTGALVVVIRQFSGLPEGVMYAILLMNGLTPLIDRVTQPRTYGTRRHAHGA